MIYQEPKDNSPDWDKVCEKLQIRAWRLGFVLGGFCGFALGMGIMNMIWNWRY